LKTEEADAVIVGAGTAGISAALVLREAALKVVVIDKSRGVGGRAATRRIEGRPVDHGAQFFTARSDDFRAHVTGWLEAGICREWTRGFSTWENGAISAPPDRHPRYCCPEGMTALAKHDGRDVRILREAPVATIRASECGFTTSTENLTIHSRALISTAPVPQTMKLVKFISTHEDRTTLDSITFDPCLTAIYSVPGLEPGWPALQVTGSPISWIADDGSRREPVTRGPFVVHASPAFSIENLERDAFDVAQELIGPLCRIAGPAFASATILHAHRWRYARPRNPNPGKLFLALGEYPDALVAGDAFGSGTLESAWLSGNAAARGLLNRWTPGQG
jgi:renalase